MPKPRHNKARKKADGLKKTRKLLLAEESSNSATRLRTSMVMAERRKEEQLGVAQDDSDKIEGGTFSKEKVPRLGDGGNVARGPAPGPGRTGRGHPAAVSHTGRGPPGSTAPGPQACSGAPHWAGLLTTAQGCQQMGKLAGAGLQHGSALHASAGSIPLCPRAVVCCLVPSCALLAHGGTVGHWVWLYHTQWGSHVHRLAAAPRSTAGSRP